MLSAFLDSSVLLSETQTVDKQGDFKTERGQEAQFPAATAQVTKPG